jgi:hypothetical protein
MCDLLVEVKGGLQYMLWLVLQMWEHPGPVLQVDYFMFVILLVEVEVVFFATLFLVCLLFLFC